MEPQKTGSRHSLFEDVLAIVLASAFVALGLVFYAETSLVTGSTAGLALLLQYVTGYGFGIIFFVLNLPFYYLAYSRLGWQFALKTFIAVGLVSVLTRLTGSWIDVAGIAPIYAALMGGNLMGIGLLILFRHRAGLGGISILAAHLQERYGVRAGYFQFGVDAAILVAALFVVPWEKALLSLAGAGALNLIIALNHRPGRYVGMS